MLVDSNANVIIEAIGAESKIPDIPGIDQKNGVQCSQDP